MTKNNRFLIVSIFTLLCALSVTLYILGSSDNNAHIIKAVPILTDTGEDTGMTFYSNEEFSERIKATTDELSGKDSISEKTSEGDDDPKPVINIKVEREITENSEKMENEYKGKKIIRSLDEIAKEEMGGDIKEAFDADADALDKKHVERIRKKRDLAEKKLNEELLAQGASRETVDQLAAARDKMFELMEKNKNNKDFYKYKYKFTITPEKGASKTDLH